MRAHVAFMVEAAWLEKPRAGLISIFFGGCGFAMFSVFGVFWWGWFFYVFYLVSVYSFAVFWKADVAAINSFDTVSVFVAVVVC